MIICYYLEHLRYTAKLQEKFYSASFELVVMCYLIMIIKRRLWRHVR